jgi:class 3 adenylate cyclase/tetratricopeptide (TPR) repeat protein
VLICPACGEENPDRAKFCLECATALSSAPVPTGEERKIVTVLFCDLVGFTAASDDADPEDVRATLRPYHTLLRTEIEGYGGTVEKFIGDAVMAVFGAPVAHEDDAERAVRSGLRILEAIQELNESSSLALSVRIGINTGEAVVALDAKPERGEGIVTGDVVNTASRLQGASPTDGVGVGEGTYRATRDLFEYAELDPVALKGKAEPVSIWWAKAARSRFGTDVTRTHTTPMVGRELEQQLLEGTFERAVRDASVQLVTVAGEPGVGKSRLVAELFTFIEDRPELVSWRQGRSLPYGEGITFWALGEIVKAHAGILESDSPEDAIQKLDIVVPAGEQDREWLKARLFPLIGVDSGPAASREEAFTAWRRFLETVASTGPAVFVFEDLHWADDALLDFLEHVAEWSDGVPMLLLCTARPELYEAHPTWAGGKRNATAITLSPLTNEQTARLISTLLEQAVLPAEVQAVILERAGGNPLYAEEFTRMLQDRGLLRRTGRTVQLDPDAEIPFPDNVQALIAARLDTLTPKRKALLQDAAVVGKVFWAGAVASMGDLDEKTVAEELHELSRKELIRRARASSMEGEAEYSFAHLLIRDVAYGQIPRAARATKHRAAAEWLEQRAGERAGDLADVLAHHYTEAIDLARAAGFAEDAAILEEPARRFLVMAGDRALGLDVARAETHFTQALKLTPSGHLKRARLLTRWADAARQTNHLAEAAVALEEAISEFGERGEILEAGGATVMLSTVLYQLGEARSREVLAEAVALLEGEPPNLELVRAYAEIAGEAYVGGDYREGTSWAEKAIALSEQLGRGEDVRALGFLGASRCGLGDLGGLEDMRRAIELGADRGLGRETGLLYNNLAAPLSTIEGPEKALETLRLGIDFAERRGIDDIAHAAAGSSLEALYDLGRWDELLDLAVRLAEKASESQASLDLVEIRVIQADVLVCRGRTEEVASILDWLLPAVRDLKETQFLVQALTAAAHTYLVQGDPNRTVELVRELEAVPRVRDAWNYPAYLPRLVRTALAAGDSAFAGRLAEGLEAITPLHEHALHMANAELAEGREEFDEATTLYAEAAQRWERFGVVPEHAHALFGQGRCLLALGDPEAEGRLREARGLFSQLDARLYLTEIDSWLERATAASS